MYVKFIRAEASDIALVSLNPSKVSCYPESCVGPREKR